MTDPTDQSSAARERAGEALVSPSRRALLGFVVALWSAGSISDARAVRLYYGMQGYGRFGYGGDVGGGTAGDEETAGNGNVAGNENVAGSGNERAPGEPGE